MGAGGSDRRPSSGARRLLQALLLWSLLPLLLQLHSGAGQVGQVCRGARIVKQGKVCGTTKAARLRQRASLRRRLPHRPHAVAVSLVLAPVRALARLATVAD